MAANHTPLDEIASVLKALETSPAARKIEHAFTVAPILVERLLLAMLTPAPSGEAFCAASMCASPACGTRCTWSVSGNPL